MPHDKHGLEVKVGDVVVGTGYNLGAIAGTVIEVNPTAAACNVKVAAVRVRPFKDLTAGALTGVVHLPFDYGKGEPAAAVFLEPTVEYGQCDQMAVVRRADGSDPGAAKAEEVSALITQIHDEVTKLSQPKTEAEAAFAATRERVVAQALEEVAAAQARAIADLTKPQPGTLGVKAPEAVAAAREEETKKAQAEGAPNPADPEVRMAPRRFSPRPARKSVPAEPPVDWAHACQALVKGEKMRRSRWPASTWFFLEQLGEHRFLKVHFQDGTESDAVPVADDLEAADWLRA